jgi:hypothetical protein
MGSVRPVAWFGPQPAIISLVILHANLNGP